MTVESKAPWTEAESHLQSVMSLSQAQRRARQLTPQSGFWRIESGPVQQKSGGAGTSPAEPRHIICIWFGKYWEIHTNTTLEETTYVAKTLAESVNGQPGAKGTGWDVEPLPTGQSKLTAWKV